MQKPRRSYMCVQFIFTMCKRGSLNTFTSIVDTLCSRLYYHTYRLFELYKYISAAVECNNRWEECEMAQWQQHTSCCRV